MIERLKAFQANRGQFAKGSELSNCLKTDLSLRTEVAALYYFFYQKRISGCDSCYMDAFIELVNVNIEKIEKKMEGKFKLLAGALLKDKSANPQYYCSNANITDELALFHLKTNPECIKSFEVYPDNYLELVEEFSLSDSHKHVIVVGGSVIDSKIQDLTNLNTELKNINNANETLILEKDNRIETLEGQVVELTRAAKIGESLLKNDFNAFVALLNRNELREFITSQEIDIDVCDSISDEDIKIALLAEMEREESTDTSEQPKEPVQAVVDSEEQKQAEDALVLQIAERIKGGETKTAIKESLKDGKVGEKNLTQRFIAELIARADELNK